MEEILPSGNIAVGLVFNYFVGFLRQVLPCKLFQCLYFIQIGNISPEIHFPNNRNVCLKLINKRVYPKKYHCIYKIMQNEKKTAISYLNTIIYLHLLTENVINNAQLLRYQQTEDMVKIRDSQHKVSILFHGQSSIKAIVSV